MDLNDKRVEQGFICPLIHSFIYHLIKYIHTCMFYPLQDAIWMNRQMDGCVDRWMNPMDEWREDVT